MDTAAVRAVAERVLDGAHRLDEIRWPSVASNGLSGSTVGPATALPAIEDRLSDLIAHLRTWATAAREAAAVIEQAELRHVDRLGEPR